jgi:hypothetical protein
MSRTKEYAEIQLQLQLGRKMKETNPIGIFNPCRATVPGVGVLQTGADALRTWRLGQSQVGEATADFADYADLGIDSSAKSVKSAVPFTSEKRTGDCPDLALGSLHVDADNRNKF